jgi:hypothetical protein
MSALNLSMFVSALIGFMGGVVYAALMFKFIVFYRSHQFHTLYLLVAPFVVIGIFAGIGTPIFYGLRVINMLNGENFVTALTFSALPGLVTVFYLATRSDSQWKAWTNRKD